MESLKQKKQIMIMLIILLLTAIAFFGLSAFNKYSTVQNAENTIKINTVSEIDSISYNNGADSLSFELNGEGKWYCTANPDFPLQTSYVESMVSTIENLHAVREISAAEQDSLAAYGLENPSATVSISGTGGQTANLLIGSNTADGYYYLKLSDSDTVYTVDSQLVNSVSQSLYDMAEIEDIPAFDVGKLSSVQINDTTITVETKTQETINGFDNAQKETAWYCNGANVSGYSQISALTYSIPYLSFSGLAAWQPSSEELQSFGLQNPVKATFNYTLEDGTTESYTLWLGNAADETHYYAMIPNSDRVYLIAQTDVAAITSIAEKGLHAEISMVEDLEYTTGLEYDTGDDLTDCQNTFDY